MASPHPGLVVIDAEGDFQAVLARLERAFDALGVKPAAQFDHGLAAYRVGLDLGRMIIFAFGDPRVGTLLMQREPTMGLDLPLKIMVFEHEGQVHVAYHDPRWIAGWHGIQDPGEPADRMVRSLERLAQAAADPKTPAENLTLSGGARRRP